MEMERIFCIICNNSPNRSHPKFEPVELEQCGHVACYFCIIGYFIATKDCAGVAECPCCFYLFEIKNLKPTRLTQIQTSDTAQLTFGNLTGNELNYDSSMTHQTNFPTGKNSTRIIETIKRNC